MQPTPFFAPTYFSPSYFGNFVPVATPSIESPPIADSVEEIAFNAIIEAIRQATLLNSIELTTHDEASKLLRGGPTSIQIIPQGWTDNDEADPQLRLRTVEFTIQVVVNEFPARKCLSEAWRLANSITTAINGLSVCDSSIPALTRISKGELLEKSRYPERPVNLSGCFTYVM